MSTAADLLPPNCEDDDLLCDPDWDFPELLALLLVADDCDLVPLLAVLCRDDWFAEELLLAELCLDDWLDDACDWVLLRESCRCD